MHPWIGTLVGAGLVVVLAGCGAGAGPGSSAPTASTASPPAVSPSAAASPSATRTPAPTAVARCEPSELPPPGDFAPIPPGTYCHQPAKTEIRVLFTIPADGWVNWPYKPEEGLKDDHRHVAVGFTTITNLMIDACTTPFPQNPPVGPTVDDLAIALAELPPFDVVTGPSDVERYGFAGKYVELKIPDDLTVRYTPDRNFFEDCSSGYLKTWQTPVLSYAFYGYNGPGQHEAFWILDVEGTRLVVEANWDSESPATDIAEMRALLDSIVIEP
jgi:hypothetical protein